MPTWEENHAGITVTLGGVYRMKHVQHRLRVTAIDGDYIAYQAVDDHLVDHMAGRLRRETFERQIESGVVP